MKEANPLLYARISRLCCLIFLLSLPVVSSAQYLHVWASNADNGQPIAAASVSVEAAQAGAVQEQGITDSTGRYTFERLRPGYYTCTVTATGFETQQLREVFVAAGKEQILQVALRKATTALPLLTVTAHSPGLRTAQPLGEISLSRDQTLRFPAMYYDPARLAAAYAGVSQTDDGINGMSIRGNGPNAVRWRLEGADVVNPNHLPNAGTFSDQPAAASGGVLLFSAQLLDNSSLLTGAFPAGYGDALGGLMDMRLRRGNTLHHEFTVQAGLIGLDVAAEGPLRRESGQRTASYLANYRYSAVGLLGQMGVSFGDEQINFQDLSFLVSFSGKKGGQWRLFGLGGMSENTFGHKTDSTTIQQYKDFFDIDFSSRTGIIGVSNWSPLGKNTWLKTSLVASGQTNQRRSEHRSDAQLLSTDEATESKICGTATLSHRINDTWRWLSGLMLTQHAVTWEAVANNQPRPAVRHDYLTAQPWTELNWRSRNDRTTARIGLHTFLLPQADATRTSIEPRLTLTQVLSARHRLSLFGGRISQVMPLWWSTASPRLQPAWQLSTRHTWTLPHEWTLRSEVYWQRMEQVGIEALAATPFSTLNVSDYDAAFGKTLIYKGLGESKGLEVTAERYLSGGWFALLNGSLFDSRYRGSDGVWRSTRWDLGHLLNLTLGREWLREKSATHTRSFGINGRAVQSGGYRAMPIDAASSVLSATTVFDARRGFAESLPGYFRFDLRVYWKRNFAERRNSTFAMDFQNVTGQKNVAYRYYDPFTARVETKYQLGLIPNLTWRLEF